MAERYGYVNRALPDDELDAFVDALNSFTTALTWPEAQQRFQALRDRGLNRPGEMKNRFGELLGTLA